MNKMDLDSGIYVLSTGFFAHLMQVLIECVREGEILWPRVIRVVLL